ncbi:MAG: cyclic nucleotide-binding domain-containing protein [Streptosporangiales bacterium]|nr:cyclic nucleotide-binding domain-containing protein [Streptosporangiales bacterium]
MGFLEWPRPLRKLPRFGDLSEKEMREVCDAGQEVAVPQGWSPIAQSTAPDKAYLVIEGSLAVVADGDQIAELGPGDLVGEIGIRERRLRTATVSALTPARMLHFTPAAFRALYDRIPAFRDAVDGAVAVRQADNSARSRKEP